MPALSDTSATCSCITEEQLILVVNHAKKMVAGKLISVEDYNYPLRQVYQYRQPSYLKGAESKATMPVQYAALIRVEFIPDGYELPLIHI